MLALLEKVVYAFYAGDWPGVVYGGITMGIEESVEALRTQRKIDAERFALGVAKREKREEKERIARVERAKCCIVPFRQTGEMTRKSPTGILIRVGALGHPVLRIDGDDVLSSEGARIPVALAKRILSEAPKLLGRAYDPAFPVGDYRGAGANGENLRLGCHSIPWHEVRAFCIFYGWDIPEGIPA